MESIYSIRKPLLKGAFMATIDLRDVYLHVPIALEHQSLLMFLILLSKGIQHSQFQALPFILTASNSGYSKRSWQRQLLACIFRGSLILYLDHLLIYGSSLKQVGTDVDKVFLTLKTLGCIPRTVLVKDFLGYLVDTRAQKLLLSQEKSLKVAAAVSSLMEPRDCSRRKVMRVLGLLTFYIPAVPWTQLHSRELQFFLLFSLDRKMKSLGERVFKSKGLPGLVAWPRQAHIRLSLGPVEPSEDYYRRKRLGLGCSLGGPLSPGILGPDPNALSNHRELLAVGKASKAFKGRI